MIRSVRHVAGACALALLLAGCGGSDDPAAPPPVAQPARADVLATAAGGIDSIAFSGDTAWLSLSNTATTETAVVRASLPLRTDSAWSGIAMGECGLAREEGGTWPLRAPSLRMLGSSLWLFQPWYDKGPDARPEHALCALSADRTTFVPRDAGLKVCTGGTCSTLSMTDLKQANGRLYTNAGGGQNVLASNDGGKSFQFVIRHPLSGGNYPYIRHLIALAGRPDTLVAGGFDKATQKPYLAWSKDGGTTWTDLSSLLPGYARNLDDQSAAAVTAIAEDPQGRVLVAVNEKESAQGRLVLVTP